jgi:AraC-like DNA-binding protein
LAKIAIQSPAETIRAGIGVREQAPSAGVLSRGDTWTASDVVCTYGPQTRPFEERHSGPAVAVVVSGTFQYRSGTGDELMTPGSLLLGNEGQHFECAHEHGIGDRCLSLSYAPDFFDRLTADAGCGRGQRRFQALRLPPIRALAGLVSRASQAIAFSEEIAWEEFAVELAATAVQLDRGTRSRSACAQPGAIRRVTQVVRMLEAHPEDDRSLIDLARAARLSPFHFLRTFEALVGVTPHQYVLRTRLQRAAIRLSTESSKVLDIALNSGFGDISNFNRTFRAEFGVNPRAYRAQNARRSAATLRNRTVNRAISFQQSTVQD